MRSSSVVAIVAFSLCLTNTSHAEAKKKDTWKRAVASVFSAANEPALACRNPGRGPGVAHKTLPCGTKVRICYKGCVTAKVIDRGPYVYPREFDLDTPTARLIKFPYSVATISWRLGGKHG